MKKAIDAVKKSLLVRFSALALLFLLRWQIVQLVAWAMMLPRYMLAHGPGNGWRMTFDGAHPCAICRAIEAGGMLEQRILSVLSSHPSLLLIPALVIMAGPSLGRRIHQVFS